MPLEQHEVEQLEQRIARHIKQHLAEWLSEMSYGRLRNRIA